MPGGGEAVDDRIIWRPLEQQLGGNRVVLLDRLVVDALDNDDGDEDEDNPPQPRAPQPRSLPRNAVPLYLCRLCGTLHATRAEQCDGCGSAGALVELFAIRWCSTAAST